MMGMVVQQRMSGEPFTLHLPDTLDHNSHRFPSLLLLVVDAGIVRLRLGGCIAFQTGGIIAPIADPGTQEPFSPSDG